MPDLVEHLFKLLEDRGMMMAAAESCTGGMIAAAITDRAGSSSYFDRGFVTYSNEAKENMLGVPHETLEQYGAVSEQTAKAMAEGTLAHSRSGVAVAVTGIAGPGGGTETKPVGLVYIGAALKGDPVRVFEHHFEGDRASVRYQTVQAALGHAIEMLERKL